MAASVAPGMQNLTARPTLSSSRKFFGASAAFSMADSKGACWTKLTSTSHISSFQPLQRSLSSLPMRSGNTVIREMAESSEKSHAGLSLNLKGKRAFIAGIADDNGYGWAIAKSPARATFHWRYILSPLSSYNAKNLLSQTFHLNSTMWISSVRRLFSSSTRIPLPSSPSSSSIAEKIYTHYLKHTQNPERTLTLVRAKLDSQCINGVLHRCRQDDKPQLGLRFFVWAGLQSGYRHSRYMYSLACKLFEIDKNPNTITELLEGYKVDGYATNVKLFKIVLNLCKEALLVDEGLAVLRKMEGFGCRPDSTMFNVVIRLFCEKDGFDVAMGLIKEMEGRDLKPDMISYMLMLKGFCNAGKMEEACSLFREMRSHGCTPNSVTYSALLDGLCKTGAFEKVLELLEEMENEGGECMPNVITYTSIIHRFCEKGKSIEALPILDRMKSSKCSPNRVTMSVLIDGLCTEGKMDETYKLIDIIVSGGHVSSGECYSSLMISLLRNQRLKEAQKLFKWMLENAMRPDGLACSILMKELCLKGEFLDAFNLYENVEKARHVLTMDSDVFGALLFGLCQLKHEKEVKKLVSFIVRKGIQIKASYIQAIEDHLEGSEDMDSLSKLWSTESSC